MVPEEGSGQSNELMPLCLACIRDVESGCDAMRRQGFQASQCRNQAGRQACDIVFPLPPIPPHSIQLTWSLVLQEQIPGSGRRRCNAISGSVEGVDGGLWWEGERQCRKSGRSFGVFWVGQPHASATPARTWWKIWRNSHCTVDLHTTQMQAIATTRGLRNTREDSQSHIDHPRCLASGTARRNEAQRTLRETG